MTAVGDSIVAKQIEHVIQNSHLYGWEFEEVGDYRFGITLTANDGDRYQVEVDYEGFPGQPPAFHWRDKATGELDQLASSPNQYDFFIKHGNIPVICAPWNRLASQVGPHNEWRLADWQSNERTGGTKTLSAMLLRIEVELKSDKYQGRQQ